MFAAHARRFSHKAKVVITLSVEKMQALQHSWHTSTQSSDRACRSGARRVRRPAKLVLLRRLLFGVEQRRAELVGERGLLLGVVRLAGRENRLPGYTQIAKN